MPGDPYDRAAYRADVDGLRAVAILSVLVFHALPTMFPGGFIGVDIFFVISGFLIGGIIVRERDQGRFHLGHFYVRRVRRIFPALIVVLFCCLVFGHAALLNDELENLAKHIAAGAGFLSNFILWSEVGYFDAAADTKPLLHLWSLGIEEQFYLFFPAFLLIVARPKSAATAVAVVLVLAISFGASLVLTRSDPIAAFYSPLSRFWELMLGCTLAIVAWRAPHLTRRYASLQSILGAACVVLALALIAKGRELPGWWILLPTVGTALLISAGPDTAVNRFLLGNRVMAGIGLISYPLYLWHWPMLSFLRITDGRELSAAVVLFVIALSFVLAVLTYAFIEKPLRFEMRARPAVNLLLGGMVAIGAVSLAVFVFDGALFQPANRIYEQKNAQFKWNNYVMYANRECLDKYSDFDVIGMFCQLSSLRSPPTAAIIGDSHSNHFFWGLSEYYKARGGNLANFGNGACPPLLDMDRGPHPTLGNLDCHNRTKRLFEFVRDDPHITTVFLSFNRDEYFRQEIALIDRLGRIDTSSNEMALRDALVRTIEAFRDHGKRVVVMYEMPPLKFHARNCFAERPLSFGLKRRACDDVADPFRGDFKQYDALISAVRARTGVEVFDPHPYIQGNFPVSKSGIPMYRDTHHLSLAGSHFFIDKYNF